MKLYHYERNMIDAKRIGLKKGKSVIERKKYTYQ